MLHSGDFSAWITVDEGELTQYAVQHSTDNKQVTCWIPSVADKNFTVCWRDPIGKVCTGGYLTVDGLPCGATHLYRKGHPYERSGRRADVIRKSTVSTSSTTQRPFSFARLELTDDDAYLDIPTSSELGDIKLEIYEVQVEGKGDFNPSLVPASEADKIHERSKKAVGHRVKLGEEFRCRERRFVRIRRLQHIITFTFRYRPLAILQASGIVPLDTIQSSNQGRKRVVASSTPSSNVLDLTIDEDNGLQDRPTKRVKTEIKAEVKAEVKSEGGQPWSRSLGMKQLGGVIDLT
ncbi:hypothetical protein BDZ94DRAFT_1235798 [Collybia nuda]|uniref:DUF7918 domain-containing protein n=1 Tax=Collybia nuda TaxID=64659 RepID=A0A9P5Y8X4_9AGAR|nr:hypothetical protein BDZ94DRAFT_1235798 [Collybia nuda]